MQASRAKLYCTNAHLGKTPKCSLGTRQLRVPRDLTWDRISTPVRYGAHSGSKVQKWWWGEVLRMVPRGFLRSRDGPERTPRSELVASRPRCPSASRWRTGISDFTALMHTGVEILSQARLGRPLSWRVLRDTFWRSQKNPNRNLTHKESDSRPLCTLSF